MSLVLDQVSYSVKGKKLISEIDLTVSSREVLGLIGPNGAGKSTALKLLSGDYKPHQGKVLLDGGDMASMTPMQLSHSRSVMTQTSQVVFDFTVREIIEMGWVRNASASTKSFAIGEIIESCLVADLVERRFNTLSGGEQQRVQFARSLLQLWRPAEESMQPRYMLLDEPTASMDIRFELGLLSQLRHAIDQDIGVVIVLHDLNLAARFMDQLVLMDHGQVVACGTPEVVLEPDQLSNVYQTPIQVERNDLLNRLLVHS